MKQIEITYTREVTFSKIVSVSDKLAERLLALDGESDLIQKQMVMDDVEDDEEGDDFFNLKDVSTDDFSMIAEDLTSIHDVFDMLNQIEDIEIREYNESE